MGDIAEMMLDGILDANGEYTGRNPGHPVYPKGWFNKETNHCDNRVKCFLMQRGIDTPKEWGETLMAYKKHFNFKISSVKHACSNWPLFKAWVDERVGYVKPSKQPKS